MSLHQAALASLEEQKSLCIARIESLKKKLADVEARLAHLDAGIKTIRGERCE